VLERAPLLRQLVFHSHRRFRNHDSGQDSLAFELAQALRQHAIADIGDGGPQLAIADIGDGGPQLGEAHPSVQEQLNHGTRPTATDEFHRPVELGAQLGFQAHAGILAELPT
jgi:hypothetical protein